MGGEEGGGPKEEDGIKGFRGRRNSPWPWALTRVASRIVLISMAQNGAGGWPQGPGIGAKGADAGQGVGGAQSPPHQKHYIAQLWANGLGPKGPRNP